ncbi:MAG: hypothetical protein ACI9YE_002589 [Psychroserpens sp.]|jgi:hypothetical protein
MQTTGYLREHLFYWLLLTNGTTKTIGELFKTHQ